MCTRALHSVVDAYIDSTKMSVQSGLCSVPNQRFPLLPFPDLIIMQTTHAGMRLVLVMLALCLSVYCAPANEAVARNEATIDGRLFAAFENQTIDDGEAGED